MSTIQFISNEVKPNLRERNRLRVFIQDMLLLHKKTCRHLNFIFCSDEYLLNLNKNVLKHNYFTDIITFDLSTNKTELIADIYISIDRVADNAIEYGDGYQKELHRVIFHGILHLVGFKDKTKKDSSIMRQQEALLLTRYFNR
jgi:rRNA maturation RNase YbeY